MDSWEAVRKKDEKVLLRLYRKHGDRVVDDIGKRDVRILANVFYSAERFSRAVKYNNQKV